MLKKKCKKKHFSGSGTFLLQWITLIIGSEKVEKDGVENWTGGDKKWTLCKLLKWKIGHKRRAIGTKMKTKIGLNWCEVRLRKEFQESPTRSVKGALNQEIALGNIGWSQGKCEWNICIRNGKNVKKHVFGQAKHTRKGERGLNAQLCEKWKSSIQRTAKIWL